MAGPKEKQLKLYKLEYNLKDYHELMTKFDEDEKPLDVEYWQDTLIHKTNEVQDILGYLCQEESEDDMQLEVLEKHIENMRDRANRIKKRKENLRQTILNAFLVTGITRLDTPVLTISLGESTGSVDLLDAEMLGDYNPDYFVIQEAKLDKAAILRDLRNGKDIPGVRLKKDVILRIKRK